MQDNRPAFSDEASSSVIAAAAAEQDLEDIKRAVLAKLTLAVGKDPISATDRDWFVAAALTARDRIIHRWLAADRASRGQTSPSNYDYDQDSDQKQAGSAS